MTMNESDAHVKYESEAHEEGAHVKYESINLTVRVRADGQSWFDILGDLISADCQGILDNDHCTCGLEFMGGMVGTLEQCYESDTAVGNGLHHLDLAKTIIALSEGKGGNWSPPRQSPSSPDKVIEWARNEIDSE